MAVKQYIEAGKIINTHGVNGAVKIEVWMDSPDFLKKYKRVFISGKEYRVISAFVNKEFLIVSLEGCSSVELANKLRNKTVSIDRNDVALPEGRYFIDDILGAEVCDEEGKKIGILTDVMDSPSSNIYIISGEDGAEHLIPAVPEFVLSVDPDEKKITLHLIEGM